MKAYPIMFLTQFYPFKPISSKLDLNNIYHQPVNLRNANATSPNCHKEKYSYLSTTMKLLNQSQPHAIRITMQPIHTDPNLLK
jgi:hypothetical protein